MSETMPFNYFDKYWFNIIFYKFIYKKSYIMIMIFFLNCENIFFLVDKEGTWVKGWSWDWLKCKAFNDGRLS